MKLKVSNIKKIICFLVFFALIASVFAVNRVLALQNIQMKDAEYGKDMYTPAFPLIFEDLRDKIAGGKIEFVNGHSYMIDVLNSLSSPKNRLDEKFYYKTIARKTLTDKKKIENAIKEKFNEKSSIIDMIQWEPENKDDIILYSMVKKNIEFLKHFAILDSMEFNGSDEKFKYFGTKDEAEHFKKQVKPLFYKNENNYAISLKTKSKDEVILYMIDSDFDKKSIHSLWKELNKKIKQDNFKDDDKFFAPFIEIKEMITYDELSGKEIKGTDYRIEKAIESVEFSLDNEGAMLKNEAIMAMTTCALKVEENPRYFYFNKPFVLFIKEDDKKDPYFMVKIKDTKYLVKE